MKKYLLIAVITAFSSSFAFADELFSTDTNADGAGTFYGGISVGQAEAKCSYTTIDCDSTGWKLYTGYNITPSIAVEGGFYSLVDAEDTVAPGVTAKVKSSGLALTGVATVPVADNLQVFGKGGVIAWKSEGKLTGVSDINTDGTDALLGAGATYMLGENWGIRGEYEHVGGDLDANIYSVGATFSSL